MGMSRVYCFSCRAATQNADVFSEHVRRANRYYNLLIELERDRREEYRRIRASHSPELASLENALEGVEAQIEKLGKKAPKSLQKQRETLRAEQKLLRKACDQLLDVPKEQFQLRVKQYVDKVGASPHASKRAREQITQEMLTEDWSDFFKETIRLDLDSAEKGRQARAASGLHHGTYTAVEKATIQAWKKAHGTPEFRRFDGTGRIGVQIQGGYTLSPTGPVRVTHGQLEIEPVAEGQWDTRSGRRHAYTTARIRLGSHERKPIWAEFPVLMHRRPVGKITWAYIVVKRTGNKLRYELQLTVNAEKFNVRPVGTGVAAINFGWRSLPNGNMRVAYLVDDTGHEEAFQVYPHQREQLTFPDELKSIGDRCFNQARANFVSWMKRHGDLIPDDIKQSIKYIKLWKCHAKLARTAAKVVAIAFEDRDELQALWRKWVKERLDSESDLFDGKGAIYRWAKKNGISSELQLMAVYLEWWRKKNRHLYDWESNQRDGAVRFRREDFRKWARKICDRYATILLDDSRLDEMAERPAKGTVRSKQQKRAATNRFVAAPGQLRLIIGSASYRKQTVMVKADSKSCSYCGTVPADEDRTKNITLSCEECGTAEDQDARACRNMLASYGKKAKAA
jgi:hypothetical protein